MKDFFRHQNYLIILLVIVFVSVASFAVYHFRIMTATDNDYSYHILVAEKLLRHEPIQGYDLSHPMLQIAQIGLLLISRNTINLWEGTILLMVGSNILLALGIYFWFGKLKLKSGDWLRAFWATTLTFAAPIMIFAMTDGKYYYGYIGLANYHNPTVQLLRAFALPLFILALQVFIKPKNPNWMTAASALLVIISTLIKPNLAICLLPSMVFFSGLAILQKKIIDWKLEILGFIIPAGITLIGQYFVSYSGIGNVDTQIIFAPLVVESAFSEFLLPKFFLSLFFPLVILILFNKTIFKVFEMQLAWFTFLLGVIQVYIFAESGSPLFHGNFRWSAQITLLILFIASARFVYQRWGELKMQLLKEKIIVYLAYLPHVVGGIVYFIYCLTSARYS
jgi:hypothetical protein